MVTIGNADPVLALIRSQLERMAKAKRGEPVARTAGKQVANTGSKGRLPGIAALADLPERDFGRAIIGALLTGEFGEDVAADPRFQSVIDRVADMLREDERMAGVMADVRRGLLVSK